MDAPRDTATSPPLRPAWRWALDVGVAAACGYAAVILTVEVLPSIAPQWRTAALTLAVLHGAVLVLRRAWPAPVLIAVLITGLAYSFTGVGAFRLGPAVFVALYTVASREPRRVSVMSLVASLLMVFSGVVIGGNFQGLDTPALYTLLVALSWFLGDTVQRARRIAAQNARRADELEQAREELASYAVTNERLRIARELHDIVAHRLSVISMHAASARLALDAGTDQAREALSTVEVASRDAMTDLRQLLTVLRSDADDTDGRAPAPVLQDLSGLVADVAATGVTVDVTTSGNLAAVPAGVALAAYRIVQEALTNVVKHAGRTRAVVRVEVGADAVAISVRDSGAASAAAPKAALPATGQGTIGMRERVALYGGDLHTGPTPDGGWSVEARLPLHGEIVGAPR